MYTKYLLVVTIGLIITINSCNTNPSSSKNTRPTADFTVNPESGDTGTLFTFDANSSYDKEDETVELRVRWDWENDGTWDTNYSTIKTYTHQYSINGIYTIALEVIDTEELIGGTTNEITVLKQNTAPRASFSVEPTTGNVNDVFSFDASNSYDEEDNTSELQVRWDWENDSTWDTDYSITKTATHQFEVAGNYTIRLNVKDTEEWTNSTTRNILVQRQSTVVNFSDESFEALIRLNLNKNNEDITDLDLMTITSLNGNGWNISDISGIEYCTSLQKLDLQNNNIDNINALSELFNLQNLNLSNNQLININSLSGLINLQILGLANNTIIDIDPLNSLLNLNLLFINNNQVVNINPLINLTSIKELGLADNQITEINALIQNSGIDNGDIITLTDNPLNDMSINTYIPQLEARGVTVVY